MDFSEPERLKNILFPLSILMYMLQIPQWVWAS